MTHAAERNLYEDIRLSILDFLSIPLRWRGDLSWISALHFPEPAPYSCSTTWVYIQGCHGSFGRVLEPKLHLQYNQ